MSDTLWVVGSIGDVWLAGTTDEITIKAVYINTSPQNVGRQSHPYFSWVNNEIILGSLSKRTLEGNTFYFQVVDYNNRESSWFGPITIRDDLRAVYINTSPVEINKQVHPYLEWSDTSVSLAPLTKVGIEASEFYVQVSNKIGMLSNWFGPFTIGAGIYASLNLSTSYSLASTTEISGTTIHQVEMRLNTGHSIIPQGERQGEIFASIDLSIISQLEAANIHLPLTVKFITLTLLYPENNP